MKPRTCWCVTLARNEGIVQIRRSEYRFGFPYREAIIDIDNKPSCIQKILLQTGVLPANWTVTMSDEDIFEGAYIEERS